MHRWALVGVVGVVSLAARVERASAQPAPPPQTDAKSDAKSLMQTGLRLLEAKEYVAALQVFRGAYQRFHSAKILLNIATTLKLMDRKAEAANEYQRYLDAKDSDPARRAEVAEVIADLDKSLGRVAITVTPGDAEVQIESAARPVEGDDWQPASEVKLWRAAAGPITVRARREGYQPAAIGVSVEVGADRPLAIVLQPLARPAPIIVTAPREHDGPRSRFGARATVHVSLTPRTGGAVVVGGTADLLPQLELDVGAVLGPGLVSTANKNGMTTYATGSPPSAGAYVGASYTFLPTKLRPLVAVGFPMFVSHGARFAARAAGGIEYVATRQLALTLELGLETNLNPESDIRSIAFVPALAVAGRL